MRIITGALGEPHVTSNDDGEMNQSIFGSDLVVLPNGNKLDYEIISNNTIRISDGDVMMQGRHALINPNETEDVTIESATIGFNRKDLIVVHYEMDTQTGFEDISLRVLKGTETSGTPQPPSYTEGDIRTGATVAELPLYEVTISTAGSISQVALVAGLMSKSVNDGLKENVAQINVINGKLVEYVKAVTVTQSISIKTTLENFAISYNCPSGYEPLTAVIRHNTAYIDKYHVTTFDSSKVNIRVQGSRDTSVSVTVDVIVVRT